MGLKEKIEKRVRELEKRLKETKDESLKYAIRNHLHEYKFILSDHSDTSGCDLCDNGCYECSFPDPHEFI